MIVAKIWMDMAASYVTVYFLIFDDRIKHTECLFCK